MGVRERLDGVRKRMGDACARVGRGLDEVCLIAVAKRHPPERIREAVDCGLTVIGENRVQEARAKIPLCPGGIEWHMIGHLQRNKVKVAVGLFSMIHSVDSMDLLQSIDSASSERGQSMPVCLEVNVSGESCKFGLDPREAPGVLNSASALMNVDVVGLMTMPPFAADPEDARPHFRRLRELRDEWREATGFPLAELSMGMSGDFEVAIEEGATFVRVGTAIFGDRD